MRNRLTPRASRDEASMLPVVNLAVRAVLLVLVGSFVFTERWPGAAKGTLEVVALGVTAALLALWVPADRSTPVRSRYPTVLPWALGVIALLCGAASALPPGNLFIILGVSATVSAGSDAGLAAGCIVLAAGIVGIEATGLALGASASVTVEYPIILLLGLVLGRNLQAHRQRAEHAEQLREKQALLATLDERTRIAREIHDVLAHSLGALGLQIQLARALLTEEHDEARADAVLQRAQKMAGDGLTETRRAVHALRGDTPPLREGLTQLTVDHQRRHGCPVEFGVTGDPRPLPPDATLAITRTAQEALVNAAKHAPAQPVEIRLDYRPATTTLIVANRLGVASEDDGARRFATVDGCYGLAGMRERLLLLNGTLSAEPRDDTWVVTATVPR